MLRGYLGIALGCLLGCSPQRAAPEAQRSRAPLSVTLGAETSFSALGTYAGHQAFGRGAIFDPARGQLYVVWQDCRRALQCGLMGQRLAYDGTLIGINRTVAYRAQYDFDFDDLLAEPERFTVLAGSSSNFQSVAYVHPDGGESARALGQILLLNDFEDRAQIERVGAQNLVLGKLNGALYLVRLVDQGLQPLTDAGGMPVVPIVGDTFFAGSKSPPEQSYGFASAGGAALMVWTDGRDRDAGAADLYGKLIDSAGMPGPEFPIALGPADQREPQVAWGGGGFLVVWEEGTAANRDVQAAGVSLDGSVSAPLAVAASALAETGPALAFDGTAFVTVWHQDGADAGYFARGVTPGLALLPQTSLRTTNVPLRYRHLACEPTGTCAATWGYYTGVFVTPFRLGAVVPPAIAVDRRSGEQIGGGGAFRGSLGLLTWKERLEYRGAWVGPSGAGAPFEIRRDEFVRSPVVAAAGQLFLAAWNEGNDVLATRLAPNGSPLDTLPLRLGLDDAGYGINPGVMLAEGSDFLLIGSRMPNSPPVVHDVWAARVHPDGGSTPSFLIWRFDGGTSNDPSLVNGAINDAGVVLAVWESFEGPLHARAIRFRGTTVLDPAPLVLGGTDYFTLPQVASDGLDWLAVWMEGGGIHARRVFGDGGSGAAFVVSAKPGTDGLPYVMFDGFQYLVTFTNFADGLGDFWGTTVARDGTVGTPFAILASPEIDELAGGAVATRPGSYVMGFHRFDPEAAALKVHTIQVTTSLVNAAPCTVAADCESGFCTDGVCCTTACGAGAIDCQACSVAAGAPEDGVCGPVQSMGVCRAAISPCDDAERCDGTALTCPADAFKANGQTCSAGATCTGGLCLTGDGGTATLPDGGQAGQLVQLLGGCGLRFDFTPTLSVASPASHGARRLDGAPLPASATFDEASGAFSFVPEAAGLQSFVISAQGGGATDFVRLEVLVECKPRSYPVGCGCDGAGAGLGLLAALGLLRRARRLRP